MKTSSKNPTIAALLGLVFGPLAYLYIWRIGRGLIVLALNFLVFTLLFGDVSEYTPQTLAASLMVSIIVSFDCWRIAKKTHKSELTRKTVDEKPQPTQKPQLPRELYCASCGIGLATPVKVCPQCMSETKIQGL